MCLFLHPTHGTSRIAGSPGATTGPPRRRVSVLSGGHGPSTELCRPVFTSPSSSRFSDLKLVTVHAAAGHLRGPCSTTGGPARPAHGAQDAAQRGRRADGGPAAGHAPLPGVAGTFSDCSASRTAVAQRHTRSARRDTGSPARGRGPLHHADRRPAGAGESAALRKDTAAVADATAAAALAAARHGRRAPTARRSTARPAGGRSPSRPRRWSRRLLMVPMPRRRSIWAPDALHRFT